MGLQVGSRDDSIEKVLVTLDVTEVTIEEAKNHECGLILTHHPLIFQPLSSASDDTHTGRLIRSASRAGIAIVAAHTNLDSAENGLADTLAGLMELKDVRPLVQAPAGLSKLVVFVPETDLERVRLALFATGAGVMGDYSHCSFMVEGTGTFLPGEEANPTLGIAGRDEKVSEVRLETVFPSEKRDVLIDALVLAHSYEEPAYDIYPLENRDRRAGCGRLGELAAETRLDDFAGWLAGHFGMDEVRYNGPAGRHVQRVAVVPGSGADYINVCDGSADVLVTGDIRYHQAFQAAEAGLALVDIPHEISETLALQNWAPRLEQALGTGGVKVMMSAARPALWQTAGGRNIADSKAGDAEIVKKKENHMFHLHVDGGSRGNPGPAGIGAILKSDSGEVIETIADYIGEATNNVAEYQALITGVEMALDHGVRQLAVFSDSELIVRQLEGRYKVKNEGLRPYYQQAKSLLSRLEDYELAAIPREANAHADELVNAALDEAAKT